jgi:tetratricopeptide (TPR) repeat protein
MERDEPDDIKLEKLANLLHHTKSIARLPLLAALLSIDASASYQLPSLTPLEQKRETLRALVEIFEKLAAQRPLLFVLEDAHWIDPTTHELIDMLTDHVRDLRAMIVITHRPEFDAPWTSHSHCTVLALTRLSRTSCMKLIDNIAGGHSLPIEVIDQIVLKSDGIPLFLEEITKDVLESGLLVESNGSYVLSGPLPPLAIPSTLQDSLMARLDRLDGAKEIAQVGAAIGREFSHRLIEAVSSRKGASLQNALDILRRSEIIFRRGTPPDATYVFKHALIQDTAYDTLLRSRRQEIHARIAQVLKEADEAEPELIAHHFTNAGLFQEAAPNWLRAGQRALARSANQEAIWHLKAALDALERSPPGPDAAGLEVDVQVGLGSAWIAARGYSATETEAAYTRARALLGGLGDDPRRCSVLHGLAMVYVNRANPARALEVGEEILRSKRGLDDHLSLLVGHRVIAVALNFLGRFSEARQHAEQAVASYDVREHRDTAMRFGHDQGVGALWHLSIACCFLGDQAAARKAAEQAVALTREIDNANTSLYTTLWDTFTHLVAGEAEEAARIAREMIDQSRLRSMALWTAFGRQLLGGALVETGRFEEGLQELQQGNAEAERLNNAMLKLMALRFEAQALAALGRFNDALGQTALAMQTMEETGELWWQAEVYRIEGEILIASGRPHAENRMRRALEIADQQKAKLLQERARAGIADAALH